MQPMPSATQVLGHQVNNPTSWTFPENFQQLNDPQAFGLQTNNSSAQTYVVESTTTTTTNTTDQTTHAQQYIPPSIGQQSMQHATQYNVEQYNHTIPYGSQQVVQQPAPQVAQQQPFDYTQLAQALPTLPPAAQPAFDYTQLATLPPAAPQHVSNASVNASTQTTVTRTRREEMQAQRDERRRQREEKQGISSISTSNAGGAARQAAAANGDAALRQFDQTVQQMLMRASGSVCSRGFTYWRGKDGYLCGGGNHFVSNKDVDNMVTYGVPPYIENVNAELICQSRRVSPPADGWHEPMHFSPRKRLLNGMLPMPLKHDGAEWDVRPFQAEIEQMLLEVSLVAAFTGSYW